MAYTNHKLDLFKTCQTFCDLNPDKAKFANQASQYRYKAKKTNDPEKRKQLLKEAEELDKIWKSMKINTPNEWECLQFQKAISNIKRCNFKLNN